MAENQSVPEISEYYGATCESKMKFKINADGNTISLNTLDAIEPTKYIIFEIPCEYLSRIQ